MQNWVHGAIFDAYLFHDDVDWINHEGDLFLHDGVHRWYEPKFDIDVHPFLEVAEEKIRDPIFPGRSCLLWTMRACQMP